MNRKFLNAAIFTIALAVLTGCRTNTPTPDDGKLKIVATTGMVGDMVRNIVGEHGNVQVMMGPGVDPHGYQESPSDIRSIEQADVVFFSGLHLEGRMAEVLERRGERFPVFAVTEQLEKSHDARLRYPEQVEGFADPHVWHDAALWSECAAVVAAKLAAVDPDHANEYATAAETYRKELLDLDDWCRQQIETLPKERRVLVTAHDAFAYFSDTYGLESVGMKGISTEDEVAIGRMEEIIELVIERKLPAVFVESSVSKRIVEALIEPCAAAGHKVAIGGELYSDSLGSADKNADTYTGMMRSNIQTIVTALQAE